MATRTLPLGECTPATRRKRPVADVDGAVHVKSVVEPCAIGFAQAAYIDCALGSPESETSANVLASFVATKEMLYTRPGTTLSPVERVKAELWTRSLHGTFGVVRSLISCELVLQS